MFLLCLKELGYLSAEYSQILHLVFYRYISLVRKLQTTYMLEPAGSHGVWGLDDYHFLPFLFGAAELVGQEDVPRPDSIHNYDLLVQYEKEYMYL
jgi:serine/threonine-protein phosphatase 2A activator